MHLYDTTSLTRFPDMLLELPSAVLSALASIARGA